MNDIEQLKLFMDECTIKKIAGIIAEKDQCAVTVERGIRQLRFHGDPDTELRILFLGTIRLTISNVSFKNKRRGTMSRILDVLITFCNENHIQDIVIQSVSTEEMAAFCIKHHFFINPDCCIESNGILYGDYHFTPSDR